MARPRNTAGDPLDAVEAIDAAADSAAESTPPPGEVVVPAPAASRAPATAAAETPRQLLVPPPQTTAQPAATAAAKPGLRRIGKGDQIRQVHPVDVADWLALGWQVLPADIPPT